MGDKKDDLPSEQETDEQRDKLLLRLLKTPPQPRPKRERYGKAKETRPDKRKKHRKFGS